MNATYNLKLDSTKYEVMTELQDMVASHMGLKIRF